MGGRQADENLPEVVQQPLMASASPMPEVVPNSSPEFAQQRYMERDKIPVYYDTAPKFPHEPQTPAMRSLSYQNQQPWNDAELSIGMLSPNSSLPWQSFHPYDDQQTYVGSEPPEPEKLICGLRKRPFIIIAVIIALVVVGAAVGGAVGGSMAARQGSSGGVEPAETSSASSSSATSSSSTTTTTTTPTPSSTTSSGPSLPTPSISFLWKQTDETYEGYAFQAYEKNDFEGKASLILWEEGFFDLGFDSTSWIWIPNGLDACVTFCASKTEETGYACMPRRRNATKNNISFKRVHIWRGAWNKDGTVEEMSKKCS